MVKNFKYILLFFAVLLPWVLPAQVVINEVFISPSLVGGSTTNSNSMYNVDPVEQPPYNREWIELYNTHPCDTFDLSCFTIACNMEPSAGSGYSNWGAFTFPAGTKLLPLQFLIIGGNDAQVPVLDFNMNYYRQNFFGIEYLDGDYTRWFLRDEYGWLALYDASGVPVDAVFWDIYGNPGNLAIQEEYAHAVVTSTACSGTQVLPAAINISGIEYAGMVSSSSNTSLQRINDGENNWYQSAVNPTPRACNGICVGPPTVTCTVTDESCAGGDGSITVNIVGGQTGPYTIQWIHPLFGNQSTVNNLSAGIYIVSVIDGYGCFTIYDTVQMIKLSGPTVAIDQVINESCSASNGSVTLSISGGNLPLSYYWNSNPPQTGSSLVNVSEGTYSVTITDNLGCSATQTASLINQPGPEIQITFTNNEMCSAADGFINTLTSGGTMPLHYSWNSNPVQTTENLSGVHAGNYTVTVTDENGCTATASASISDTPPPKISFTNVINETCHKGNGSATLHIEGGNPPYNFSWLEFPDSEDTLLQNLSEGIYSVIVYDSFCSVNASVQIDNIPGPIAAFRVYPEATTIETPRILFYDESTGASEWNWDFGDLNYSTTPSPIHIYNDTGIFKVRLMIFDGQGCMDSVSHNAIILDYFTLFVPNAFTPNGDGVNDVFFASGQNITDFEIYIYNRWGEVAFHSTDINSGWNGSVNGKPAPDGVYSWILWYKDDYRLFKMDCKSRSGHLTLLR